MKFILLSALTLMTSVLNAAPNPAVLDLLEQMNAATEQMNYEIDYVLVSKNNLEPMRYRHAVIDGQEYAHLSHLSGATHEVIRRANEITYFEPGFDPYTVAGERIVAPIPVFSRNFDRLSKYYNFSLVGQAREAGLPAHVVRISPKGREGYTYLLWVDQKSKLLLRADLVGKNNLLLEQLRAVKLIDSPAIIDEMQKLVAMQLPAAITPQHRNNIEPKWLIPALPDGFEPVAHSTYRLLNSKRPVENLMFSDGLFSFSIYFAMADPLSVREKVVRSDERSVYSQLRGNVEITLVGDIPPELAEKIVKSIQLKSPIPTKP